MVLLLGSSGYVGKAFQKYFKANDIRFITHSVRYPLEKKPFDALIKDNNIKSVINCSGYVGIPNVDSCEQAKLECLVANGYLPRAVAQICENNNIPHVFISSGCIFFDTSCENGEEPYKIFDNNSEPNFSFGQSYRSWYSGTKAFGESLLKKYTSTSICRLRIPFNSENNPRNYIFKAINYSKLVNSTNSFSNLDEFVNACYKISELPISQEEAQIYNLTQPGHLTTKDVVALLQKYNLVIEKEYFKTYKEFLSSVKAPRSNCVLKSCSERADMPFKLTPIKESMEDAIKNYSI